MPIGNGIFKETLSYFTARDIEPGSLVFAPLRKRKIPGILLSLRPVRDIRAEIKNSEFGMKKIDTIAEKNFLSPEFMRAAKDTADQFVSGVGQTINCFVPGALLRYTEKKAGQKPKGTQKGKEEGSDDKKGRHFTELVQAPFEERIGFYKSLIREEFARKNSIFLCLPTVHDRNIFFETLKKGIEEYAIILRPEDSPKKMGANWTKIKDNAHPLLIVGTPLFLSAVNEGTRTIVIEKENSPAYKNIWRPYIDMRFFAKKLAENYSARIILGDTILSTETLNKKETEEYTPSNLFKYRFIGSAAEMIVNMKDKGSGRRDFALGNELIEMTKTAIEKKENTLLLSVRKGLAASAICGDCGTIVECETCGGATTLQRGERDNVFSCYKCGSSYTAKTLCKKCGSWNLKTLGVGTEKIEEELKELFGPEKIMRMDGDSVKSHKQGKQLMGKFLSEKGMVLVGTEMALFYLTEPVENIGVVSADTLFSIPDFRMNERIFNYLVNAKLSAKKRFIIQTRYHEDPLFDKISRGDLLQFFRTEIIARREFGYPPFKTIIKITMEGSESGVDPEMKKLAEKLSLWKPDCFRTPVKKDSGKMRSNILIKVNSQEWPKGSVRGNFGEEKTDLNQFLKRLPPNITIKVDPDSIL